MSRERGLAIGALISQLRASSPSLWPDLLEGFADAVAKDVQAINPPARRMVCVDCKTPNERCTSCAVKHAAGKKADKIAKAGVDLAAGFFRGLLSPDEPE